MTDGSGASEFADTDRAASSLQPSDTSLLHQGLPAAVLCRYGEKLVKNSVNPRSYYKCSHPNCGAKKIVERDCNGDIINTEYKVCVASAQLWVTLPPGALTAEELTSCAIGACIACTSGSAQPRVYLQAASPTRSDVHTSLTGLHSVRTWLCFVSPCVCCGLQWLQGDHTHPAPSVIKPMRVAKAKGGSKGANQVCKHAWHKAYQLLSADACRRTRLSSSHSTTCFLRGEGGNV